MNNSEKNRLEREKLKAQKEAFKARKLIRDQEDKEKKEKEIKDSIEKSKTKKPTDREFLSISLEKLYDKNISSEVSLTDMLGINSNDYNILINNTEQTNSNTQTQDDQTQDDQEDINDQSLKDRHYIPDFM
jgi:hypothetical protein